MPSRSSLQLCEVMTLMHVWNSKGVLVGGGVWGLSFGRRPWQRTKDLREAKGKEDMGHEVNAGRLEAPGEKGAKEESQAGGESQGTGRRGAGPRGAWGNQGWTQELQACKSFLRGGCDLQDGDLSPAVTTATVTAAPSLELACRDTHVPSPSEGYSMSSVHPPDGTDCPEPGPS